MPDKTASRTPLAAPSRPTLWRRRDFLLLWSGSAADDLGSAVSTLLIPLLAVQGLGATTFQVAMLGLARRLPAVFLSLPAGVIVDRVRKRRLMTLCHLVCLFAMASLPLAALFGKVALWQLYVVTAVVGSATVFFGVAYFSYLPTLLSRDELVEGNAKLNASETAADAAGPALGALLAGLVTAARAIAVDAVSYAVGAMTLLLMRAPDPRPEPDREQASRGVGFREAMTIGLRIVARDRVLRAITTCTAVANLGIVAVLSLEVVYLVRSLHVNPAVVGLVLGVGAIGGFAGSLVARRAAARFGGVRVMWLSLVCCAPFALLMPLAGPRAGVVLYMLGWGVFNVGGAVFQTAMAAYRQLSVPSELLGRVNATIRWIVFSTMPLGTLLAGGIGTWLGMRTALWIATAALASTGLWLLASPLRGMRELPEA